ncbi:1-deoxy-D-xylulose 5-phosphate reductoisomerase [Spiroplasma chinense]|uniref:1-deoxy-D-xylulose 5-phosphate reductoisomerase n=1 Tax=Spiroplasma chinense TaxID=216932 RepID=A0A5B9Y5G6_9MOLU|nr:1-deoxy-D-xylulose-5-phosphate reductoisomerase [Spiroplasma chinense]QEH62065.1 1-deoxy-D-xylulose 5-phosphate reductoisomerase [Spiroplasma chinense]
MKNVILFGASGNIGKQTIEILKNNKNEFNLKAVSIGQNTQALEKILKEFKSIEMVFSSNKIDVIKNNYPDITFINNEICDLFQVESDIVINALSGFFGLKVTLQAIENDKLLLNANKESFVTAGNLIEEKLKEHKQAKIFPLDSEHCAIFQCLEKENEIEKIYLTASGGPFRNMTLAETKQVTLQDALKHPNWSMGKKITIDSATMFNKAFEILEAYHLFKTDKIETLVHPESIIHSMVLFKDGSIKAQLSKPDMKQVINYFLFYPTRKEFENLEFLDFSNLISLNLKKIDQERFEPIKLAQQCFGKTNAKAIALNAANEVCVQYFLDGKLEFYKITEIVSKIFNSVKEINYNNYSEIVEFDNQIRKDTERVIKGE